MPIPIIALSLAWIGVIENLQVALRHPQDVGPPRGMAQDFARQLGVILGPDVYEVVIKNSTQVGY